MCLLIPENPESVRERAGDRHRLEERFLLHPALALEQSRQVTDAMAQRAHGATCCGAMELVHQYSATRACRAVEDTEDAVDQLRGHGWAPTSMKITGKELTASGRVRRCPNILHTISDFERISDHALNICEAARGDQRQQAHGVLRRRGRPGAAGSGAMRVTEILHVCPSTRLSSGDLELAGRVEPLEEIIDGLCDEMKLHHVDRLQKGVCTLNQGFVFNDLLTNYERVADHCSNIAVAMIELESDSFDTHEYLNSVKAMKSASFARYSAEYQKKYTL